LKLVSSNGRKKKNNISRSDVYDRNSASHNGGSLNESAPSNRSMDNTYQNSGGSEGNRQAKPKKKIRLRTVAIIASVCVVVIAGLLLSFAFYVDSLSTVFPNVWAEGIRVSGLTLDEVKRALIDEGYERNADGIAATIVFPDENSFTVTGEDAGLSLDAEEAAAMILSFGRDESFFGNTLTYVRSLLNRTDLQDLSEPKFDDSMIRALASEYTYKFNETLIDSNIEYTDEYIIIVKGTGFERADSDSVFNLTVQTLKRASDEHTKLTVYYVPDSTMEDDIDIDFLFGRFHEEPVASELDMETLSATESSYGRTFDISLARQALNSAVNGEMVKIELISIEPEITQEELQSMLFRDVLAESTTRAGGNSNRVNNIARAAELINESEFNPLRPGDIFSFEKFVGPRTARTGFLTAGVIIGGRLQEGIGGGICQTSSTLYDAVLHTQLEVIERRPHSIPISYLPYGRDAAVADGGPDFKFKNNTDFPIRIEATMNGEDITVRLMGTKLDDTYIELESVALPGVAITTEERPTDELLIGETRVVESGRAGVAVEIFQRLYSEDGNLISRTSVGVSRYRMQPHIIEVGTREPPPAEEPIDTGDTDGLGDGGEG